jgi:hypothetical protein
MHRLCYGAKPHGGRRIRPFGAINPQSSRIITIWYVLCDRPYRLINYSFNGE